MNQRLLIKRNLFRIHVAAAFFSICFAISQKQTLTAFQASQLSVQAPWTSSWEMYSTDCRINPGSFQKAWDAPLTESSQAHCQRIDFSCEPGTEVLLAFAIEPTFIIPELQFELQFFTTRPNLQLLLEVTFPHSKSPTGNGPLTGLIRGPQTTELNCWTNLSIGGKDNDLTEQLRDLVWIMRRKLNVSINSQNAYISKVVVNAYSSAGPHRVWLRSPSAHGLVKADLGKLTDPTIRDLGFQKVSFDDDEDNRPAARSQRQGTVIEVDQVPFMPLIIQHNGEPFAFLKQMGFNTIQLGSTATMEELRQARELGLWVICPPPPSAGVKPMGDLFDPVLAWSMGERLNSQSFNAVQKAAQEIRSDDSKKGRPLFLNCDSGWQRFSQFADIVSTNVNPFDRNFPIDRFSNCLQRIQKSIATGLPICADIQTELSSQLVQQSGMMADGIPPTPLGREQLKYAAYEAIAGGARALRMRSRTRLDSNDPQTRLRVQTITWLNHHLLTIEPWIVGGVVMGESPSADQNLVVTTLKTNRGQLLLVQRPSGLAPQVLGETPIQAVQIDDTFSAVSDQAYLLDDVGLTPLPNNKIAGGSLIQLDQIPQTAAIILTQNPEVLNRINVSLQRGGVNSQINLRLELTRQWLAFTQIVESQLSESAHSSTLASGSYNEALNAYQQALNLIRSNSPSMALPYLDLADQRLATVRYELLNSALQPFTCKVSAPLLSHISLLPKHWGLTESIGSESQVPNALPGGDFEDLDHMIQNGWSYSDSRDPQVQSHVELSGSAAGAGNYGLKLTATSALNPDLILDETPLSIHSAPVHVESGQLILIHGWIKIEAPLQMTERGVTIFDSVHGPSIGLDFVQTSGWQEFKLFRCVGEPHELQVVFELHGIGTVMLDEITVRTLPLDSPILPRTSNRPESNTPDK